MQPHVCIAILGKKEEKSLALTLRCVEDLDYSKDKITIYINIEASTDEVLVQWLNKYRGIYKNIYFNNGAEEHNVRRESMEYAIKIKADFYFVINTDNCVIPETLRNLVSADLPI